MKTYHASPKRDGGKKLVEQLLSLESISIFKELTQALPYIVAILNENRQIIFTNEVLIDQIQSAGFHDFFGKTPGAALGCVHTKDRGDVCGTTEQCAYCGVVNTILASLNEDKMVTNECLVVSENNGIETVQDFMVTSRPFYWNDERFLIFTLADISGEKRRRMLERIFFHDILNTAGNLKGISELIPQMDDMNKKEEFLKIIQDLSVELVEEIEAQKQISAAESGELIPKYVHLDSYEILETVKSQFRSRSSMIYQLKISDYSEHITFFADRTLLVRIIKNMVKNALEASRDNDVISLGVRQKGDSLHFEVRNPGFIPRNVQMQIFKRSFSTKAFDRGLGTYSMKLLGERYLKGKVFFTTSEEEGTGFFFAIPLLKEEIKSP
jgi:signal transduction histidine kinase